MRKKQPNAQAPPENETPPVISAMPIHIRYVAKIGQVSLTSRKANIVSTWRSIIAMRKDAGGSAGITTNGTHMRSGLHLTQ